jgi:transcription elongation factor Elf1
MIEMDPRFVCRREGHDPLTKVTGGPVPAVYLTECKRCGKTIEMDYTPNEEEVIKGSKQTEVELLMGTVGSLS